MMNDLFERYDFSQDELYDDDQDSKHEQWVSENADEIVKEYQETGLFYEMIDAHKKNFPTIQTLKNKAKKRYKSGSFDEAVFHWSRCYEGYLRAVYLSPISNTLTLPLSQRLPIINYKVKDFVDTRLMNNFVWIHLGLLSFTDEEKAKRIIGDMKKFFQNHWETRNVVDHTLRIPEVDIINSFRDSLLERLNDVSLPIEQATKNHAEQCERNRVEAEAQQKALADQDIPF